MGTNTKTEYRDRTQHSKHIKFKVVDQNNNIRDTFETRRGAEQYAKDHGGTVKPI